MIKALITDGHMTLNVKLISTSSGVFIKVFLWVHLFFTKQSSSESQASQEAEASEKTDEKSESSGEGEQAMDTGDVDDSIPLRQAPAVLPEMEIKPFTMAYGMEKQ